MLMDGEKATYALCRPPGHHAATALAGGYCYLNNSAIATQNIINQGGKKVAILDIDFHHGNGTQEIFYTRNDVLTISIHAHPNRKFPYFTGFEDEIGSDAGENFNHNFPLPSGITDDQYLKVLNQALNLISNFDPEYLVVPLGFDTYKHDPICDFNISLKGFFQIGSHIASMNIPTLIVQEGGYCITSLGICALRFLKSFTS